MKVEWEFWSVDGFNGSCKPSGRFLPKKAASLAKFVCPNRDCGRTFNWKRNLTRHLRYECGLQPRFKCPYCVYSCKVKADVAKHIPRIHKDSAVYVVDLFKP
ncbi:hypothetical protein KM043_007651 [Ampulex compressa]|nr:hypothetical protein KM043_007651 [Ampulex compressa]